MNAPYDPDGALRRRRVYSWTSANPDLKDSNGYTALHHASAIGALRMVNALIVADKEVKDCRGMRPLALAAANHRTPVVSALITAGATANILGDQIGHFHGDFDPDAPCEILESLSQPDGISKDCTYTRYCTERRPENTVQYLLENRGPSYTQYINTMFLGGPGLR
jgi:hypothetical protein